MMMMMMTVPSWFKAVQGLQVVTLVGMMMMMMLRRRRRTDDDADDDDDDDDDGCHQAGSRRCMVCRSWR